MQSPPELGTTTVLLPTEEQRTAKQIQQSLVTLPKGSVTFRQKLGNGAFGVVYQGKYQDIPVAIKEVNPRKAGKGVNIPEADILQAFEWEVSRLSTLSHHNLVRFYGVCENEEGNACLVMELCKEETLENRLKNARNLKLGITPIAPAEPAVSTKAPEHSAAQKEHTYGDYEVEDEAEKNEPHVYDAQIEESVEAYEATYDLTEEPSQSTIKSAAPAQPKTLIEPVLPLSDIWRIALEIAYGLAYLHQKGTLHRDLKSENILFGFNDQAKLADLGVAQVDALIESQQAQVVAQGMKDFRYAAPEEFTGQSTPLCDMYSYGLVLWELVTGESVESYHVNWRREGRPEIIPDYCPPSLRALIEQCWAINPLQRPTAKEVMIGLEAVAHEYTDQPARACLAQQTLEILEDQRAALSEYIPSDVEDSKEAVSIQTQLQSFMQSETHVCVIMGAGGLGKSLAGYVLADQLLHNAAPNTPIPILIRPAITPWVHMELSNGIQKALSYYRLTSQAIEQLKQTPVLFIIDGYDELSGDHQGNLPRQLGLNQWPNAKLLISVRPDAVPQDKRTERFSHQDQLVEYTLKPFDQTKVETYLKNSLLPQEAASLQSILTQTSLAQPPGLSDSKEIGNPGELEQLFTLSAEREELSAEREAIHHSALDKKLQNLNQAISSIETAIAQKNRTTLGQTLTNPFVLSLFIRSWDSQKKQDLHKLTQASIYQTAIQHWVTTQATHLPIFAQHFLSGTDPSQEVDLEKLWQAAQLWFYQTAFAMTKGRTLSLSPLVHHPWNQLTSVIHQYAHETMSARDRRIAAMSPKEAAQARKRALLNVEQYQLFLQNKVQQFFALCPLKDRNGQQQFIHKTLWEYSVAAGILQVLSGPTDQSKPIQDSGLHPEFILNDIGVLTFLRTLTTPEDITHWETWIEASKQNPSVALPAACAITALNGLQKILAYRHWAGIRIPEADLRGAPLEYTDLIGSDLRNIRWEAATLHHTRLQQATLTGARFGQRPMLEFEDSVECIAFHPSGTLLATGLKKGQIVLHNPETRCITATLEGHTKRIGSVAFSPDGQYLASGSYDDTIRLWVVDTGAVRAVLKGQRGVISVAFSPDGQYLVSGGNDHTVCLWTVDTGTIRATLKGHTNSVCSVTFSPDGQCFASGSADRTIRLWWADTGTVRTTLSGQHTQGVTQIAFSPDGQCLASGSYDETVCLWAVDTGTVRVVLKGHTRDVNSVVFSPDGQCLASGSMDGTVCLWAADTGAARATLAGPGTVEDVAFSPDGHYIASGGGKTVRLWAVDTGVARATLTGYTDRSNSVAFSPDGKLLASGNGNYGGSNKDNTVRLWAVDTGASRAILTRHRGVVSSVVFSPDEQYLASGSDDRTVCLWSVDAGTVRATLSGQDAITSLAFSPDSQCLASGSYKTVCLWAMDTYTARATLSGHTGEVRSIAFSPKGQCLASGSRDKTVHLWAVDTGLARTTLLGHTDEVRSIAFSPDGQCLASGSNDKTVRLWAVDSGITRATFDGAHTAPIWSIAFSPDGQCFASSGLDQTVRLWDLRMNTCFETLHFAQNIWSITYAITGQLGIAVGKSVQYWTQAGSQTLSSEKRSNFRLLWRTDISTVLNAKDCDLTDAIGLTDSDTALLEQLGAKGKPAPAALPECIPSISQQQPSQVSASSSNSTSTSLSALQTSTTGLLSPTELSESQSLVVTEPTTSSPISSRRISLNYSPSFFSQTQSSSSGSSIELISASTTTTTTTVSTTVSVSSLTDQYPKKQNVAQLIAQFTALGSKESSQPSPGTKNPGNFPGSSAC